MSRILGLDMATKTGYCVIDNGVITTSGVWDFTRAPGEHYGHMFNKLKRHIESLNANPIDKIGYELAHHRAGPSTRIGVGMNSVVLMFCASNGIKPKEIHTATLKKWATGNGRAEKDAMQLAAKKFLGRDPEDDNEADAILIAEHLNCPF